MKRKIYPELVKEMAKRGETQLALGKLLGVPGSSINKRLIGETEWSISEIDTLCKHFNKDYYELFKRG